MFSIVIFEALKLQRAPGAGNLFLKPDYNPGQGEILHRFDKMKTRDSKIFLFNRLIPDMRVIRMSYLI